MLQAPFQGLAAPWLQSHSCLPMAKSKQVEQCKRSCIVADLGSRLRGPIHGPPVRAYAHPSLSTQDGSSTSQGLFHSHPAHSGRHVKLLPQRLLVVVADSSVAQSSKLAIPAPALVVRIDPGVYQLQGRLRSYKQAVQHSAVEIVGMY